MSDSSGGQGDDIDTLISNANARTLGPIAVGTSILLWSGVSVATIIIFNILRPRNKMVYQPKVKYHVGDKAPPQISSGLFSWISPVMHCKEDYLLEKIGLDAVVFLRFLRFMRWLFLCIALLCCGILIPIDVAYNTKNVDKNSRDVLSQMTVRDVSGNSLYAHVGISYLICGLVIVFTYMHWQAVMRLRRMWLKSPEYMQSFYARTLLIQKVPKSLQSDEGLRSLFSGLNVPYPATSLHIARRVGRLPELIDYHNKAVAELEHVLVRYLKGGKIGNKRPTITVGGFRGMGGEKRDAIDFYTNRIKNTENAIEEARGEIAASKGKAEGYGFASMASVPYAHIVAYALRNKRPKGTMIHSAPNPKDIIWENLRASDATLVRKKTIGWVYLIIFAAFNTIPVFALSVLANLNAIAHYFQPLANIANEHTKLFGFVSGNLPPIVSAFFGYFFPIIMRWLSQYQGAVTGSRLDRAVLARYFAFMIISQLVIFTLIGVLFNAGEQIAKSIVGHVSFKNIVNNLHTLPDKINRTYIDQSSYWLTFFPLRGFLITFDLAQLLKLIWTSIRTRLFGRTPRDIREWTQPEDFEYAIYYTNLLFMGSVALVFAPLAPLVPALAAVVFFVASVAYKYQLMFVFVTRVESGGKMWNPVINRILFSVIFMQLLITLTMGLQHGWRSFVWVSTLPPVVIVAIFKSYLSRKFGTQFRYYIPSDSELQNTQVHSDRADNARHRLEKRFGHPALHADLFTPMLHARMMHLLPQVYHGKLASQTARLDEYGGQKIDTQVTSGGIRIAAIEQRDLEYDPALYQRDRGELEFDQQSMSSTARLTDGPSAHQPYGSRDASRSHSDMVPAGYDHYMAHGPGGPPNIEMSPLLRHESRPSFSRIDSAQSQLTAVSWQPEYPAAAPPPMHHYTAENQGWREAPTHRPYPSNSSGSHLQYPSQNSQSYPPQQNFAGRGAGQGERW